MDVDLANVGSGFGGSILAMVARRLGLRVALLERGRHPRFAIGESSSPLPKGSIARRSHCNSSRRTDDCAESRRQRSRTGSIGPAIPLSPACYPANIGKAKSNHLNLNGHRFAPSVSGAFRRECADPVQFIRTGRRLGKGHEGEEAP